MQLVVVIIRNHVCEEHITRIPAVFDIYDISYGLASGFYIVDQFISATWPSGEPTDNSKCAIGVKVSDVNLITPATMFPLAILSGYRIDTLHLFAQFSLSILFAQVFKFFKNFHSFLSIECMVHRLLKLRTNHLYSTNAHTWMITYLEHHQNRPSQLDRIHKRLLRHS